MRRLDSLFSHSARPDREQVSNGGCASSFDLTIARTFCAVEHVGEQCYVLVKSFSLQSRLNDD